MLQVNCTIFLCCNNLLEPYLLNFFSTYQYAIFSLLPCQLHPCSYKTFLLHFSPYMLPTLTLLLTTKSRLKKHLIIVVPLLCTLIHQVFFWPNTQCILIKHTNLILFYSPLFPLFSYTNYNLFNTSPLRTLYYSLKLCLLLSA